MLESPPSKLSERDDHIPSSSVSSAQWFTPYEPATSCTVEDEGSNLEVSKALDRLRQLVLKRQQQGYSLRDIFQHFDRRKMLYFDAEDFSKGLKDLKIALSGSLIKPALGMIALDGRIRASFGEFSAFIRDPNIRAFELRVREAFLERLKFEGLLFLRKIDRLFRLDQLKVDEIFPQESNGNEFMTVISFLDAFKKLAINITSDDILRLALRLDIHGSGSISILRFRNCLMNNISWREGVEDARAFELCVDEASRARKVISQAGSSGCALLNRELIDMCERLRIQCISESHLHWIAAQALQAPLPPQWVLLPSESNEHGPSGQVFYNTVSHMRQREHPLEAHFRSLRETYRNRYIFIFVCRVYMAKLILATYVEAFHH